MSNWKPEDFTLEIQEKGDALIGWCDDNATLPKCGPGDCEGHYDMSKLAELWIVNGPEKTYPYNDNSEGYYYSKKAAHLIAAAPDLLAAARDWSDFLDFFREPIEDLTDWTALKDKVAATIANATGAERLHD